MNLLSTLISLCAKTKSPEQVISNGWSDREAILSRGVNLFCWRRPADTWIAQYLNRLLNHELENIKIHIGLSSLDSDLRQVRKAWDPAFEPSASAFWRDLSFLAKDFLRMSDTGAGILHLRMVRNDACSKFHLDGYDLRLFTTYHGPGTEWLPEKGVRRTALGKNNHQIVKDPKLIKRMEPFEVGILKGEIPNRLNGTPGIVHRSPSLTGSGEQRIIMRIDI